MRCFQIPSACLLLLLSAQLLSTLPLQSRALTTDEMDVLKLLLDRLEEAFIPAPVQDQPGTLEVAKTVASGEEGRPQSHEEVKDYLSARNLKNVKFDSGSKRYSTCFGRRLDRIGSMSTLGCNTVGRSNPKRK